MNASLTRLSLAYNGFADAPSGHLGQAIASNTTLLELDLSFNEIKAGAAMVLAVAFSTASNHSIDLGYST